MPNALIHETSPYLLQHAHNPVEWYPWGEEALQKAQTENKPIIVSVGYAACHWCHVMERESFEDEEVAALMNQYFVCIKVDREERPDIDKIYMDAVMVMTGRGGWPLHAVALPDGRPIYGGTYFRKDQWMNALQQVASFFQQSPKRAQAYASELVSAMQQMDVVSLPEETASFKAISAEAISAELLKHADLKWGGRNVQANKFPLPVNHQFFLRLAHFTQDETVQEMADVSLEKMAYGGMYDHLGGGFARYSVDAYWKVPHFEKMLYDNGQLVSTYAEAYLQNPRPLYKKVVADTLQFVKRELTSPEGAFYASLDADSEGEEGKFYTWDYEEVAELLGDDLRPFADYYNLHPFGNWEGRNVLFVLETEAQFAQQWKLDLPSLEAQLSRSRAKLFAQRAQRERPGLDDKVLASWNGLMLRGCVDAYAVFQEEWMLEMALANARFIRDTLADEGRLYRNFKDGRRTIPGFLDDYAHVISAYVALYQVTFDEEWLRLADGHLQYVMAHFDDPTTGLFFYTSDEGETLIRRKTERQDDVIPASNSTLAHALHDLGLLLDRPDYRDRADRMLHLIQVDLQQLPGWHANWGMLWLKRVFSHYEVAITGDQAQTFRLQLSQPYQPNKIFAGAESTSELSLLKDRFTDRSTIYVCEGYTCQLPVYEPDAARTLLQK